jgi:voltage-gated potassium channel
MSVRRRFVVELFRRVWVFIAVFLAFYFVAAILFHYLQPNASVQTSLYWAIVTLSTTGYGDVVPTSGAARTMTAVLLFGQIFLSGYLVSVIAATVIDESQKAALGTLGTDMHDHIVVLGYSAVGRAAVRELLIQEQACAVVCERPEDVPNVRAMGKSSELFVTYGPAAELDILRRVNVARAHSIIICTADDATNMIASLNVRAIAPTARVVVSVGRSELRETLRTAGVTYVASPSDMGGRLCASAAFEPEVAHTLEDISAADVQSDMQEYVVREKSPLAGTSLTEAETLVRKAADVLVIGVGKRRPDGEFETLINPPGATRVEVGDAILLLGRIANLHKFRTWYGADQGR